MRYDVFISYRRDGGDMFAHILYERLTAKGFSVFQDIESLRSGKFNTAIFERIDECTDFVLVLPPQSLERCKNEDDWVRQEVLYAISKGKNIIPVMLKGFEWPDKLPEGMEDLPYYNGITPSTEFFEQSIEKLIGFLESNHIVEKESSYQKRHKLRFILLASVFGLFLIYPLIEMYLFKGEFGLMERIVYFAILVCCAGGFINQIQTRPSLAAACVGTLTEEDLNNHPDQVFSRVASVFGKKILISRNTPDGFETYYTLKRLEFGSWDGKRVNYLKLNFKRNLEWYDPSVFYLYPHSRGGQAVKMLTRQDFVLQTTPKELPIEIDFLTKNDLKVFISYRSRRIDQVVLYQCSNDDFKKYFDQYGV